jgi:hypothetical protein
MQGYTYFFSLSSATIREDHEVREIWKGMVLLVNDKSNDPHLFPPPVDEQRA